MLSAEVACCKKLPNIIDEFSIEANNMDPEQTAVCHRGFLNNSADEESRRPLIKGWRKYKSPH